MTRAEQRALKQYPIEDGKMWTSAFGAFEFDRNYGERQAFQKGYEQAEKDYIELAQLWVDSGNANIMSFRRFVEMKEAQNNG